MSVSGLVGEIDDVRRRTRRARAGAAVPLAVLGLLVAGAAPIYALASDSVVHYGGDSGMRYVINDYLREPSVLHRLLWVHSTSTRHAGVGIYWLVAAPLAFALIAAYYVRRARRTGLSVDGWRVAAVGAVAFVALVATMAYGAFTNEGWGFGEGLRPGDLVSPFLVVALGVFTLAWVERSALTAAGGVAYLAALAFGQWATFGSLSNPGWQHAFSWGFMTLWLGLVLLLAAGVVGTVQRARRP